MQLNIRKQLVGYTLISAALVGGTTIGYSIYKQRVAILSEGQLSEDRAFNYVPAKNAYALRKMSSYQNKAASEEGP